MSSYILSLHRCIATCGCTDEGPEQQCEEGQRLFELVSQAYTLASSAAPREHLPWATYETQRARYYAHLGEMVHSLDMMRSFAMFPPPGRTFPVRLSASSAAIPAPLLADIADRLQEALPLVEQLIERANQIADHVTRLYLDVPRDNAPLDQLITYARLHCLYTVQRADEAFKYLAFVLKELSLQRETKEK